MVKVSYLELDKEKYKKLQKLKKQGKIKGDICPMSYFEEKTFEDEEKQLIGGKRKSYSSKEMKEVKND